MSWITQSRQRSVWLLLLVGLVLSFSLAACGQQVNASDSNAPNNNSTPQQQQDQPGQSTHSSSNNANQSTQSSSNNANTNLQSSDQQVQSILRQLDGARNDVSSSNAASSQDNGQQP